MTAVDVDLTLVTEELLEEEVPCDIFEEGCPHPAVWRSHNRHVHDGTLCATENSCDSHRAFIVAQGLFGVWSCVDHNAVLSFHWTKL